MRRGQVQAVFHTRTQLCPACNKVVDAVTSLEAKPRRPKPNDVTICLGCAALLLLEDGLQMRVIRPEDIADGEDRARATAAVREAKRFIDERRPDPTRFFVKR